MRKVRWFLAHLRLRLLYAMRDPYDPVANREMVSMIDRHREQNRATVAR